MRSLPMGFSEGTKFYRVDTGEELVTGPHVTGTEEVIVKDGAGRTVWKRAESDTSDLLYQRSGMRREILPDRNR